MAGTAAAGGFAEENEFRATATGASSWMFGVRRFEVDTRSDMLGYIWCIEGYLAYMEYNEILGLRSQRVGYMD